MYVTRDSREARTIADPVPVQIRKDTRLDTMVLERFPGDDLDNAQRLWRYMDFEQFVHMVATKSLWLAPLSSMEDKREGNWIELQATRYKDRFDQAYDYAARQTVVSCWVAADEESLPMWDAHTRPETGVAISTDVYSLIATLAGSKITNDAFYLMRVEYRDEPEEIILQPPITFSPIECAKYKAKDFEYENEVRIVYSRSPLHAVKEMGIAMRVKPGEGTHEIVKKIADLPIPTQDDRLRDGVCLMEYVGEGEGTHRFIPIPDSPSVFDPETGPPAAGTSITIKSIGALTKCGVYVSPRGAPWMHATVQSVLAAYNCGSRVHRSALSKHLQPPPIERFGHAIEYS